MTWSVRIVDKDGNAGSPPYSTCTICVHGQSWPPPCYIYRVSGVLGTLLTVIDTGADGHMACGTAHLHCGGFEAITTKEVTDAPV